jgi:ABC-type spermidine/putrescine transport system permease subunit II
MSFYNRRNALVGYLTLQAASRYLKRRRRKQRIGSGLRIAAFVALGLVSAGILAAIAAGYMKRRQQETEPIEEIAEEVGADVAAEAEAALAEPIAAT